MTPLERAITAISPLSTQSKAAFLQAWKHWSVGKDYFLLREHTVSDYIYFIEKGIARIYYYKNGKEITEWIAMDEQFFLSITSFFQRTPTHLIIQTIEKSEVYGIHHNDFMALAEQYHDVERLLRKMVTASLILSQVRMDSSGQDSRGHLPIHQACQPRATALTAHMTGASPMISSRESHGVCWRFTSMRLLIRETVCFT